GSLIEFGDVRDMVVLYAREMPYEPRDRVGIIVDARVQLIRRQTVDHPVHQFPNPTEAVEQDSTAVHAGVLPHEHRHHVSMLGRFFPRAAARGGDSASIVMIQRRESAGSMTSSISKWLAVFSALPCWYMRSTISWYSRSRSIGSSMAWSSRR